MLRAIVWYQRGAEGRPSPCRFFPSCSEYGHDAIAIHGAGRGLWLTIRRLLRCRPFGSIRVTTRFRCLLTKES